MTARDLVSDALTELGILAAGETPSAEDADLGLKKLNRLLDTWNADRQAVYVQQPLTFTLTPSLSPHTIGPTGTIVVPQRPVRLDGAHLVLNLTTPNVLTPINVRDDVWYRSQAVPTLASTIPTDCYYAPTWPNGSLYFWPVPTTAYPVVLESRIVLGPLLIDDLFSLPPGYQDAVTLSLAESLLASFPTGEIAALIIGQAARARARVFDLNAPSPPRVRTVDGGMPGSDTRGYFNYYTRSWSP